MGEDEAMKYFKLSKTNPGWGHLHIDLQFAAALYDPLIVAADELRTLSPERWEELSNVEIIALVFGKKIPVFKFKDGSWEELL